MKPYAKVGSSEQVVSAMGCPDGYIEMQDLRPSMNHVAQEDGTWLYVEAKLSPDFPIGETDRFIQDYGSLGWAMLQNLGVE